MRDTVDGINEAAWDRAMAGTPKRARRSKVCPKGFRYEGGRQVDPCTPRVRDGRCVWCEREMPKAGR